jgi:parallel beta-helix repeat protein
LLQGLYVMFFSTQIRVVFLGLIVLGLSACAGETEESNSVNLTITPTNNQKSVNTDLQSIEITFDKSIDFFSISEQNLSITPAINCTIDKSQLSSSNKVSFNLQAPLTEGTNYRATLSGIKDADGEAVSTYNWNFDTVAAPVPPTDTTSPTVTRTTPSINSTNIAINISSIEFVASENMNTGSISNSNISISPANTSGTLSYLTNQRIRFTPGSDLVPNTEYTLALSGLQDVAGNTISPYSLSFTTESIQNTTGPSVTTTAPSNNQNNVNVSTSRIIINFNKAMNRSQLEAGFSMAPAHSGSFSMPTATQLVFTPTTALSAETSYSVRLSNSSDLEGNPLENYAFGFTTGTIPDTSSPSRPGSLRTAAEPTGSSVQLEWNASTDNISVSGYRVMRGNTELTSTSNTSYTDSSVSPATEYEYTVVAFDAAGNTATSTALSIETPTELDTTLPTAPTNLRTAAESTSSSVQLEWDTATDNVAIAEYRLMRGNTELTTTSNTSYTDNSVAAETTYQYRVIAIDTSTNESIASNMLAVTTPEIDTTAPSVPTNLSALAGTPPTTSQIALSWSASTDSNSVTGYRIYRDGNSTPLAATPFLTHYDITVSAGQSYQFTVSAYDAAGNESAKSSVLGIATPSEATPDTEDPTVPGNLRTTTAATSSQVSLAWNASTDNDAVAGYRVMRGSTRLTTTIGTTYTDTSVSAQTTYQYSIVAFDAADNTATSSTLSVTTPTGPVVNKSIYYLSPTGSNNNNGTSASTPWLSFEHAFSVMQSSDELILLDGTYSSANGNGGIHWNTTDSTSGQVFPNSAQPPSGTNLQNPTIIRALNPGNVVMQVPLFLGRTFRKDSYITIDGITFSEPSGDDAGGGTLFNTSYVTVKNCGFHGGFSIGASEHHNGNTNNLIEDVWIWARNVRTIVSNYRSNYNTWRRIIVRSEGCDNAGCDGSSGKQDPSPGITVYDSHDVSMQNIMVVDRLLRNDLPYGDITTAQHTAAGGNGDGNYDGTMYFLGRNKWLGNMSVNSQDSAMTFEADNVLTTGDAIWTVKDFLVLNSADNGVNIANTPYNYASAGRPPSSVSNVTTINTSTGAAGSNGITVSPEQTTVTVQQNVVINAGRAGYNVSGNGLGDTVGYNPGASEGTLSQYTTCSFGQCPSLNSNPLNDGSFIYPTRIESSSNLDGLINGVELGARILYQYGATGSRFGEANYDTLSNISLWPWPNEARIKKEMCTDVSITRGFCSTGTQLNGSSSVTLSSYIWEFLGTAIPASIYGSGNVDDCSQSNVLCVDDTAGANQEYSTIQQAVDNASAGDTVLVFDGSYSGFRVSTSGTISNKLVIKASGNNAQITAPNGQSGNDNIYISNSSHVTIDGFIVTGAPQYGIGSHDASPSNPMRGLTIVNNTVSNSVSTNIYMSQAADSLIENNTSFGSVGSHGIYLTNAGSDDTTIRGNTIYSNGVNGIHFNGDAAGDGLHTGLLIDSNIIYSNSANGIDADGVHDSSFVNNLIYSNSRHGIRVFQIDSSAGAGNLNVVNNTLVSNGGTAVKFTQDIGGHTIFNNVMLGNSAGCIVTDNSSFVSNNNVFQSGCTFSMNNENTTVNLATWQALYDSASVESTSASVFTNNGSNDYSLSASSAANNIGLSTFNSVSAPTTDINGSARPVSGSHDAGAYESN